MQTIIRGETELYKGIPKLRSDLEQGQLANHLFPQNENPKHAHVCKEKNTEYIYRFIQTKSEYFLQDSE